LTVTTVARTVFELASFPALLLYFPGNTNNKAIAIK